MASEQADAKRLEAWMATSIAAELSVAKRRNYFRRLVEAIENNERHVLFGSTWPRLPLAWTPYRSWDESRSAGMPWPGFPFYDHYEANVVRRDDVGAMLRALVELARPAAGSIAEYFVWVVRDARRAWMFHASRPGLDTWTSGEHWQEPLNAALDYWFVDWGSLTRCHHVAAGRMRTFDPHGEPPISEWPHAADDVAAMATVLEQETGYHPTRVTRRAARGDRARRRRRAAGADRVRAPRVLSGAEVHAGKLRDMVF
jgi:hypothetical protein